MRKVVVFGLYFKEVNHSFDSGHVSQKLAHLFHLKKVIHTNYLRFLTNPYPIVTPW